MGLFFLCTHLIIQPVHFTFDGCKDLVCPPEVITDLTSSWHPNCVPTRTCSCCDSDDRNSFLTATTNVTQKFAGTRIPQSLASRDTADAVTMSVSFALLSESFPQGSFLVSNHEWPVLNADPNEGQIHGQHSLLVEPYKAKQRLMS